MKIEEIRPRLWWCSATHPDWSPEEGGSDGWEQEVSCYALVEEDALVLIDPLVPTDDEERFWRALDSDVEHHGPPQVVLTLYWHARSSQAIFDRYADARVWAPTAAEAEARERVEVTDLFARGDVLPGGIEAKGTEHQKGLLLWIPVHHALATGDTLLGTQAGGVRVCPDSWLGEGVTPAQFREDLRPLVELPVELVLLAHGAPVREDAHAALEHALRA